MRPARKGPENLSHRSSAAEAASGFNEAGPQGAGKPAGGLLDLQQAAAASMRPARKGPENRVAAAEAATSAAALQ